jgi:hypothetical protein
MNNSNSSSKPKDSKDDITEIVCNLRNIGALTKSAEETELLKLWRLVPEKKKQYALGVLNGLSNS